MVGGWRPEQCKPGHKKERRQQLLPVVLDLHLRGNSLGEIATVTGVPKATVQRRIRPNLNRKYGLKRSLETVYIDYYTKN